MRMVVEEYECDDERTLKSIVSRLYTVLSAAAADDDDDDAGLNP